MAAIWIFIKGAVLVAVLLAVAFGACAIALAPLVRRNRLTRVGLRAAATIISVEETGWTLQGNYGLARLRLRVEPGDGGAPYEVTTKAYINRFEIPVYQPGARIPVMIDPKDRTKVDLA